MNQDLLLEVCVDSVESAIAAQRGGARRVELCANLLEGGTTPSSGLIAAVRDNITIDLNVMIRPRAGDFCYSEPEIDIMRRDILLAKERGANGVVLGILNADGNVDKIHTREFVELATPLKVTFHRAFDMSQDLFRSLADLEGIGVHCVLTSGGEQTAVKGIGTLRRLVEVANGELAIMAGSGIKERNVAKIVKETGVRQIHASLKLELPSTMRFQNRKISMGTVKGREYRRYVVDEQGVRRLLRAALNGSERHEEHLKTK
jgi:copper homeostasis protein